MKLTTEKKPLLAALSNLSKVVERKNTMPVLGNILMAIKDGELHMRATDLDIEAGVAVECEATEPGATTVSASMLLDIVKKAPDGALIKLAHANETLTVSYGRSSFKLATLSADDFPVMASDQYSYSLSLDDGELAYLLKPAFAQSTEETRYYLNGIYLHPTDAGITSVATDGHKLARCIIDRQEDFAGIIIPRKTVAILKGIDGPVTIDVSETKIRVSSRAMVIVSKVVDGTFPNYSAVIPTDYTSRAQVNGDDIRKASDRVATVSDGKARAVKLSFKDGGIGLSSRSGIDEAHDEIDADVDGEHIELGVNAGYLKDTMAECDSATVTIEYSGKGGPMVFRPDDDAGFMALVMPFRG
jgi:DNA polymerase III subunit beta